MNIEPAFLDKLPPRFRKRWRWRDKDITSASSSRCA